MSRLPPMPGVVVAAALSFAVGAVAFAPVPRPFAESEALSSATLVRGGSTRTIAWGHDAEPKVTSVSDAGTVGVAYGWIEAVPGVGSAAVVVNGVTNPVVLTREWNVQRGAVTGVSYQADASVLASFRYSHPTNGTRASRLTLGDGSYWEYGYDGAGRLTNAVRRTAAGAAVPGFSFRYAFDGAGNSVAAGPAIQAGALWNFEAAGSQFHVRRVWSNLVEIVGQAASDAVVSVRTDAGIVRAERNGLWFAARVPVSNQSAAVHTAITVAAVRNDGTNDLVQETRGRLFVPRQDEALTNSVAGAILNDSRWTFTWDWYRRLIAAESSGRTPEIKLDFTYDPEGRRVRKQIWEKSGGNWVLARTHRFTNLGWRPVEEEIITTSNTVVREYVWGLDLSGTPEGAGGIGGLVAIRQGETVLLPLCDAMGNVRHLVDSQGAIVASYDYDPFGRLIARSGASADACPFLFSTKYLDDETGLYYFGYRYYDPCSLKWLCRDPLGEQAGPNLTAFCRNDPVNNTDPLGLTDQNAVLMNLSYLGIDGSTVTLDFGYRSAGPWSPPYSQRESATVEAPPPIVVREPPVLRAARPPVVIDRTPGPDDKAAGIHDPILNLVFDISEIGNHLYGQPSCLAPWDMSSPYRCVDVGELSRNSLGYWTDANEHSDRYALYANRTSMFTEPVFELITIRAALASKPQVDFTPRPCRTTPRYHGNDLRSPGPHDVYVMRDAITGRIYHFGETGRGYEIRGHEWQADLRSKYGLETIVVPLRTVEGKLPATLLQKRYIRTYEKVFGFRPGFETEPGDFVLIQKNYR